MLTDVLTQLLPLLTVRLLVYLQLQLLLTSFASVLLPVLQR